MSENRKGFTGGMLSCMVLAMFLALVCISPGSAAAVTKTYTTSADFDLGTLINVNHNPPNDDQLQLNVVGTSFPILWIANAGEDTVSKFDTSLNKEIARYRTWFGPAGMAGYAPHLGNAYAGAAPSRTAVDTEGNVYIANRHFDGRRVDVIKILTNSCIDRNLNGVCDTSTDLDSNGIITGAEIKPMADTISNGVIDPAEIQDEKVAWVVQVGPSGGLGRSLCIGTDGNIWVGMYNAQQYYKISSVDGHLLAGPIGTAGNTPYGCLVDSNGMLWGASLSSNLLQLDTNTNAVVAVRNHPGGDYGIALGNGHVYQANYSNLSYTDFNPVTNAFTTPAALRFTAYGIATDGDGNIIAGNINGGVTKFAPNGAVLWSKPAQGGTGEVRGVAVDQNNDVWLIHRTSNNISKYRGTDGGALGVFPIGDQPYTYSDAAGFAAANITTKTGNWAVILDGVNSGTGWGTISWNGLVPAGAGLVTAARAANSVADLALQAFQPVTNGAQFAATGRFLEVQTTFTANAAGASPVLYDLTIASIVEKVCDVDRDGDIDQYDLSLISRARGQTAQPGDLRDSDKNGLITPNDVKVCIPQCTRPNCAVQ